MHPLSLISALYGQARGYHRLDIWRRAAANERLPREKLARVADREIQHHIHRSIARFPLYAERVKAHLGSLPKPGERVELSSLPVWTRDDQRAFFAQQTKPDDAEYVRQTSGSTGHPVRFHAFGVIRKAGEGPVDVVLDALVGETLELLTAQAFIRRGAAPDVETPVATGLAVERANECQRVHESNLARCIKPWHPRSSTPRRRCIRSSAGR